MRKLFLSCSVFLLSLGMAFAQDTTDVAPPIEDGDEYGDAQETKRFCTQKVRNLTPTKLYSIGYEVQGPFDMSSKKGEPYQLAGAFPNVQNSPDGVKVKALHGLQLGVNYPIVSKSSVIISLMAQYAESRFIVEDPKNYSLYDALNRRGLRTGGVGLTMFKPLNEENFIIGQAQVDVNGNYFLGDFNNALSRGTTVSWAAIFGWKKSDDLMWGLGFTQTYRGGEKLLIPIWYYNRTFNDNWGMEVLFPARIHGRYNFSPKSLLQFGYEIVGNSYLMQNVGGSDLGDFNDLRMRRSEVKIRAIYERSLKNFLWISAQAGVRYNYKFNLSENDGVRRGGIVNDKFLLENEIGLPVYFNISLNVVSP
jgi:hypothetical protein